MSEGSNERVIFKQWYKPRNAPSTKVLNQKHLVYIATRPGAMKNPDCGFGLWGKIPGMDKIGNIDDLGMARRTIGEASETHTIYRAVLSVNKETAQKYDLYERAEWEKLLRSRISMIQRGMYIKKENFCWMAAMHYKKNHPHVHIVYWDAGKDPKQEHVAKKRFEHLSENVRKTFTAAIEKGLEINALLTQERETEKEARAQLAAIFKEANIADALDLDHVKQAQLDALGRELTALAMELPVTGRLYYQFMPEDYKARLDAYLGHVLQVSDFAKLEKQYLKLSGEVSALYGNRPEDIERRLEEARQRFVKDLGNETLRYLKSVKEELEARSPPANEAELIAATRHSVRVILQGSTEYHELLATLPNVRTPLKTLRKDEDIARRINELTSKLAKDVRIRAKADALYKKETHPEYLKEEKGAARKAVKRTLYSAVRMALWDAIKEDKGYDSQQFQVTALLGLLRLFRGASQSKNQLQSRRDLQMEKYRNLSETAKKDLHRRRQQEGIWEPDI